MAKKKKSKDKKGAGGKAASRLKTLADNPLVADLVAAALVSTAAALKDPKRARAMAGDAQEELTAMARDASKKGSAMWKLALDVGRQALDALVGEAKGKKGKKDAKPAARATAKPAAKAAAKPAAKTRAKAATKAAPKTGGTRAKAAAKPAAKVSRKAPPKSAGTTRKAPATRRKPRAN